MSTDTRTRLLDAALRLLVDRGYHGVGIDEIARAAGVSRQAVYQHHFKSKSQLLLALVAHVSDQAGVPQGVQRVSRALATGAVAGLDALVEMMVGVDAQIIDIVQVVEGARSTDAGAEAAWRDRQENRWRFIRRVIGQLADEGRLASGWTVDEATDFAWALISPSHQRALTLDRKWKLARYARRLQQVLREVLVRRRRGHRRAGKA